MMPMQAIKLPNITMSEKYFRIKYAAPQVAKVLNIAFSIAGRLCLMICVMLSHSKLGKSKLKIYPVIPTKAENDSGMIYPSIVIYQGNCKNNAMAVFKMNMTGTDRDK